MSGVIYKVRTRPCISTSSNDHQTSHMAQNEKVVLFEFDLSNVVVKIGIRSHSFQHQTSLILNDCGGEGLQKNTINF
jgi:hypothetical protein